MNDPRPWEAEVIVASTQKSEFCVMNSYGYSPKGIKGKWNGSFRSYIPHEWTDVRAIFKPHVICEFKEDAPAVCLATLIDGIRKNPNVISIHALGLDIDKGMTEKTLRSSLGAKYPYLLYSSFNHQARFTNIVDTIVTHDGEGNILKYDDAPKLLPEYISLARQYHIFARIKVPNVRLHAMAHAVVENQIALGDEIPVPVKVIVTADHEVANRTALGLNRQTPIDEARLFTGPEVVDALAWRFSDPSTPDENRALFERRQDEYADIAGVQRQRILTPYILARAYASAFLPRPESVNNQGRQPIIDQIRNERIFGRNHDTAPYFLCGVMVLRAREVLNDHPHTKSWERYPAKNLLLYAMRLIAEGWTAAGDCPADLESDAGKRYVAKLGEALLVPVTGRRIADEAVRCIIMATSDAQLKLNAKNAGTSKLAEKVRERAARATK